MEGQGRAREGVCRAPPRRACESWPCAYLPICTGGSRTFPDATVRYRVRTRTGIVARTDGRGRAPWLGSDHPRQPRARYFFVSLATTKPSVTCGGFGMSAAAFSWTH